jgi:hypothetical protein
MSLGYPAAVARHKGGAPKDPQGRAQGSRRQISLVEAARHIKNNEVRLALAAIIKGYPGS